MGWFVDRVAGWGEEHMANPSKHMKPVPGSLRRTSIDRKIGLFYVFVLVCLFAYVPCHPVTSGGTHYGTTHYAFLFNTGEGRCVIHTDWLIVEILIATCVLGLFLFVLNVYRRNA